MTEPTLSPAAQAVLDAYNEDRPVGDSLPRNALVEALRAVANNWRIDTEFIGGVEYICTSTLDKIADELGGK